MTLQQEKSTKSLDNLFAVKKWSCIRLIWRTSNTNELCHPKFEKCLHHTADGLKQGAGSQGAAELMPRGDPAFLRDPSTQTHNDCQRKTEMPWQNSHSVGRTRQTRYRKHFLQVVTPLHAQCSRTMVRLKMTCLIFFFLSTDAAALQPKLTFGYP